MKKGTQSSKRQAKSRIKRRYNRNKFLQKVQQQWSSDDHALDRISLLPDEALISILCRLPSEEAVATSILSTRWRHLYTSIERLEFPPALLGGTLEEFSNYTNMIERTFDLFSANTALKTLTFKIHQCLEGANLNIERWLEFALARKVETIEIQLYYDKESILYTLQLPNLSGKQSFPGLQSLKTLVLRGIHVEDPEVEILLSSFPSLETLSIADSKRLKNVSVVGIHPLKNLRLFSLENLESVEIRDMISLVSFTCYGLSDYTLLLDNVPKLTEFRVSENGTNVFPSIQPSICEQVQYLRLTGYPTDMNTQRLYQLKNVKQLDLYISMHPGCSNHQLQKFFLLITEYTSLETLYVEFMWACWEKERTEVEEIDVPPRKCPNLKRVVLSEYTGYKEELDFALLILNNAEALEQLIVELAPDLTPKKRRGVTARAWKQLRAVVSSSADLAIN